MVKIINEKLLIKTALLAGKIMMENGAEVYRIEDTMERIMHHAMNDDRKDVYYTHVTLSGLFVRIEDRGSDFLRVENRGYNLTKTTQVNSLSREYTLGKISLQEMYDKLKEIASEKNKIPVWFQVLCAGILSGGIVLIFEGNVLDIIPGSVAGLFAFLTYIYVSSYLKAPFVSEYISTFVGGLFGYLSFSLFGGVSLTLTMIGAVVPLVPGIGITNSMRDIMAKHYVSGMVRFVESFCVAFALGAGIVTVYYLVNLFGGRL